MTEQEFNKCVNLHADGLFRFIVKNLKHEEDARDVVQNSFEILWRQHAGLEFEKSKAYLFTVGYRNMIDHLRKSKKISLVEEFKEDAGVTEQKMHSARAVIEKALARLNDIQRSLVMLKDYEGYSYKEIGAITGLSASQVKVYLHRARLSLRDFMVRKENVI